MGEALPRGRKAFDSGSRRFFCGLCYRRQVSYWFSAPQPLNVSNDSHRVQVGWIPHARLKATSHPTSPQTALCYRASFLWSVCGYRTLRIFTLGGILLYTADVFGRPVALCASKQLLVILAYTGCNEGAIQLHCTLLHVHPCPPSPTSTFRLPISCIKRRLAAPPAAAASLPEIDIIHEG